jgi:ABC-type glycerol-3-phosphate transport system substrate-binding protein
LDHAILQQEIVRLGRVNGMPIPILFPIEGRSMMLKRMMLLGSALTSLFLVFSSLQAQSNETILTIGIESWQADMLSDQLLQGFYETHPGVKIVPVLLESDEASIGLSTSETTDVSLDKAEAYFSRADVLLMSDSNLSPLYTRAGYVLDLTPYMRADGSGTVDDFQPIAQRMFARDDGVWALPATLRISLVSYSKKAFDAANYPYPDSSWTLADYLDAGRALTVRDASGTVTLPGLYGFDEQSLVRALLGRGFYDDTTQPETVRVNDPEIEAILGELDTYNAEIMGDDSNNMAVQNWDWSKIPLQISGTWLLSGEIGGEAYVPVLLPGESAIVSGDGFAISAGTQHPDLAYELITYLTGQIEVSSFLYSDIPVRHSLEGQTPENGSQAISDALEDLLPSILENGIPSSELRYGQYLAVARAKMADDPGLTLKDALQQAEEQAILDIQLAEARTTSPIVVSTPVPTPSLASGEVALKFWVQTSYSSLPNQEGWDRLKQEFVDADPEVGYIEFVTTYREPSEQFKQVDCAYVSRNYVPEIDLMLLQPLDPFLSTDSTFDRRDTPDLIWPLVTRDEKTYALPMTLLPLMMFYSPADFEAAGVLPPEMGWTISDFIDALMLLKEAQPDKKPYHSNYGNAPYLLLAAGLGGAPIDYSTYMPTYHLTDPAVVEALRQVLDLAKAGSIDYAELDSEANSAAAIFDDKGPTLYDGPAYPADWKDLATAENPHMPVTYPRGSDLIPLAYGVGAGYISAQTPYAEACYRWLSTLVQHPELFGAMPARRSQITSEALLAAQGQLASEFYVSMFGMMDSPQAVMLPSVFGGTSSSAGAYIAEIWFNQALDAYVLENADLETTLTAAQGFIDDYSACVVGIEPLDSATADQQTWEAYYRQFTDCAVSVDPSLAPRFETQ